ncbi:putative glycosyl transferase [Flavobacteria bacterium BBFL7]|nr:putative glycosyl transferase [Flavobacteria bacterium BBFL7]
MSDLISIIIPTFNRAHLIDITIASIENQSYINWECIVVDDGSSDDINEVMSAFAKANSRIKFYHRPDECPKGANSCRNYGLEKSKGNYIMWFDSDDVMLQNCLELHLESLLKSTHNYSVSKFDNMLSNGEREIEPMFLNNTKESITGNKFLKQQIFFGTINVMFKRNFINQTRWNENLKSGQEYNFFCNLLIRYRGKGFFIDEVLSLRLIHSDSIQSNQNRQEEAYLENKLSCYYQTLRDTYEFLEKDEKEYLINHCLSFYFRLMKFKSYSFNNHALKFLQRDMTFMSGISFRLSLLLKKYLNKGHFFYKKSKFTVNT